MADIRDSQCKHRITMYWNRNEQIWKVECMKCRRCFKNIASNKKDSFNIALAAYKKAAK